MDDNILNTVASSARSVIHEPSGEYNEKNADPRIRKRIKINMM